MTQRVLVTGAGGFIGHHLVAHLKRAGCYIRGVDIERPEFASTAADDFRLLDLRRMGACTEAVAGMDRVYHLAADMGGIGYITNSLAAIARNNTLMTLHLLDAAVEEGIERILFTSSACVYPRHLQDAADAAPLAEQDAWPADPEPGYGMEKLYGEELFRYHRADYGTETRIARLHNVYGPQCAYAGGKEKAPAALCRKVAEARDGGEVAVWGDGQQSRSFLYIDDCLDGLHRLMNSSWSKPLNLGSDRRVTIDELLAIIAEAAGKEIRPHHDPTKPQGVRGRTSDGRKAREILGWEPKVSLEEGLAETYRWIEGRVEAKLAHSPRP